MRKLLVVLAFVPVLASAQGVTRSEIPRSTEQLLFNGFAFAVLPATTALWAGQSVAQPVTVTKIEITVYTAGGGGAGTSVVKVSDGTNDCTATFACTATASTGLKVGALTGTCSFAAGASLTINSVSSGCTAPQPAVRNISAIGRITG